MDDNMEKSGRENGAVSRILKSLLASYAITGMMLLVLAFLLYKMDLDEKAVSAGIIAIYVTATVIGGIVIGKMAGSRRFVWGMLSGALYFALLLLITLGVYRTLDGSMTNFVMTFLLCVAGGTVGGMIS